MLATLGATFAPKLCDLDEVERLVASLAAMRATLGGPALAADDGA